jgi:hypothetical protein
MSEPYVSPFQPKTDVTQAEKDELLAYARIVASPDGLALSQLRKPGSRVSLQSLEKVVLALVADGKLTVKAVSSQRGNSTYHLYFVAGGE